MAKRRERKKPKVLHTRQLANRRHESTEMSWEEAFGSEPPAVQAILEHGFLHNEILLKESDRAAAVLAPAFLDTLLEDLLRSFFMELPSAEELLGVDAPLGTFSARINAAHALGFINDEAYRDLNLIRKIRNEFAHRVDLHSFDDEGIKSRCRELSTPRHWDTDSKLNEPGRARFVFLFTVAVMVADIANAMRHTSRRTLVPPRDTPGK